MHRTLYHSSYVTDFVQGAERLELYEQAEYNDEQLLQMHAFDNLACSEEEDMHKYRGMDSP